MSERRERPSYPRHLLGSVFFRHVPFLSHPLTERSEDGGREERDEQRIGEAKRRRDEVRHGPTASVHFGLTVPASLLSLRPFPHSPLVPQPLHHTPRRDTEGTGGDRG